MAVSSYNHHISPYITTPQIENFAPISFRCFLCPQKKAPDLYSVSLEAKSRTCTMAIDHVVKLLQESDISVRFPSA